MPTIYVDPTVQRLTEKDFRDLGILVSSMIHGWPLEVAPKSELPKHPS